MAIALRAVSAQARAATTPLSIAASLGTPVTGDYRVLAIGTNSATVSTPAGWTLLASVASRLYIFGQFSNTADAASSFTLGSAVSNQYQTAAFSGVDATTPIDVTGVGSAGSNTLASLTTVTAGAMYIGFAYGLASATAGSVSALTTATGTFTSLASTGATQTVVRGGYELIAAAGATGTRGTTYSGTFTQQNTAVVALRPVITAVTLAKTQPRDKARFRASIW